MNVDPSNQCNQARADHICLVVCENSWFWQTASLETCVLSLLWKELLRLTSGLTRNTHSSSSPARSKSWNLGCSLFRYIIKGCYQCDFTCVIIDIWPLSLCNPAKIWLTAIDPVHLSGCISFIWYITALMAAMLARLQVSSLSLTSGGVLKFH